MYISINSFFLGEIIWVPFIVSIFVFFILIFIFKGFTSRLFLINSKLSKKKSFSMLKTNYQGDYFSLISFFCKYFIFLYFLLFLNNCYFFSYTTERYFFSFLLTNSMWFYSSFIYLFAVFFFIFINILIFFNVVRSVEFFLSLNFFFLCFEYVLMVNNLVSIIFIFELQSVIFIFMLASTYTINNSYENFFLRNKVLSLKPIWYFNSLLYQFWISFISTLLFIYSIFNFFKYSSFVDWYNLNIFFFYLQFSWANEFNFRLFFIFFFFFMSLFLKLGFFPFFLWKPEIYKNLNFLTFFIYITIYFFGIVFFTITLIHNYFILINYYFYYYIYLLSIVVLFTIPFFLYSISEIRPFLGYSSIIHLVFILLSVFYRSDISIFYVFVYLFFLIFFFLILSSVINFNIWYFTDFQFISRYAIINTSLSIFLLGLAGFPPFLGFFAKMSTVSLFLINEEYLLFFLTLLFGLFVSFFYIQNYRFFGFTLKRVNYIESQIIFRKSRCIFILLYFFIYLNIFAIFYVNDLFILVNLFLL